MTSPFSSLAQLKTWSEPELTRRDLCQSVIVNHVTSALRDINRAWAFTRVEAPVMIPRSMLSDTYTDDDVFSLNVEMNGEAFALRAETTPTTYAVIRELYPNTKHLKLPHAFWQIGPSFRREPPSKASRLRFYQFTQMEFQCLFSEGTQVDYRARIIDGLAETLGWLCKTDHRVVESDRLPSYASSTLDIEVLHNDEWREVASCSYRTDFDCPNLELAIGMDRLISI